MKTFAAGLTAAYASGATTLCVCLRVERADAVTEFFTSHDVDLTVGAELYRASTGLDITNLVSQSGLAVDNMEISVLPDDAYPQVDILAGQWNYARFWLFECDYTDAGLAAGIAIGSGTRTDVNLLKRGKTGEVDLARTSARLEFRGLKQLLQQSVGAVTSKTCRARLGDDKCLVDLTSFTDDVAVTVATSRHVFTTNGTLRADDYFGEGSATWLTGANVGFSGKVRSQVGHVITLSLAAPFTVAVSDTVRLVAGCRKRLDDDCKTKFDNVLNFQGEPHVPGADLLTADPDIG